MARLYPILVAIFTLMLSLFQAPQVYAEDTLFKTIQHLSSLPEEMQLKVLSDFMIPVKEQLLGNIQKIFLQELTGHNDWVSSICFSPDGSRLASGSQDKTIRVWDLKTGEIVCSLPPYNTQINSLCFSPDGSKIASISHDAIIQIWDVRTQEIMYSLKGHEYWATSICFSPDGSKLVSGSADGTIRIWDIQTEKVLYSSERHDFGVNSVHLSQDGSKIAAGLWDKSIQIWDAELKKVLHTLTGHVQGIDSVCFSPDGSKIVSGSYDGTIKIWDVRTGEVLRTINREDLDGTRYSVSFSPDGSKIAAGTKINGVVNVWDAKTGKLLQTCIGHQGDVRTISFSPNGHKIASGSVDKTIRIWDIQARSTLIKEIDRLGPRQLLLLYVLSQSQKKLKSNEVISLSKTEEALKIKHRGKEREIPSLLNLKESYDTFSPGLKKLINRTFQVVE